jgi:hypothetical protein
MNRPKSVLNGRDVEAINILMSVHCKIENPKILDCTYNTGKMWKNSAYKPTRMDIDPSYNVDIVGDFMHMPFADSSFDIIVFDPPHLPVDGASKNASKIYEKKYGITATGVGREGNNVSGMFPPFLKVE